MTDDADRWLSPREEVETTVWSLLRATYLRLVAPKFDPARDPARVDAILDPYLADLERDHRRLLACFDRATGARLEALGARLHERSGLDHDLVDEALSAAATYDGDETLPPLDETGR